MQNQRGAAHDGGVRAERGRRDLHDADVTGQRSAFQRGRDDVDVPRLHMLNAVTAENDEVHVNEVGDADRDRGDVSRGLVDDGGGDGVTGSRRELDRGMVDGGRILVERLRQHTVAAGSGGEPAVHLGDDRGRVDQPLQAAPVAAVAFGPVGQDGGVAEFPELNEPPLYT